MSLALSGKIAVVTGGSKGIGRAIVDALVREGASVAVASRTKTSIDRVLAIEADVGRAADASRAIDDAVERFGGLDILINNAGVGFFDKIADMPIARWDETFATNLSGPFYCSRAAIPHMRARGGGWIVNISSLASKNPFVNGGAYCASKAALNAFSEVLMQEVRYDNIKVSYILPGSVRTQFSGHDEAGADWKVDPSDVAEVVLDLLTQASRSLSSRIELRPSRPKRN